MRLIKNCFLSIISLISFLFLAIGSIGEDGTCNLSGCKRDADGWQYGGGKSYGVSGCARTSVAISEGWGYCSRQHCYNDN